MTEDYILVVEDEEDIAELIRYNLEKHGLSAVVCGTGEEALAQARTHTPSLVILDLMLPGVDGFEVCRRLRAARKFDGTPIVMVTAKGEESDVVAGLELGADDYLVKPFSPRVLVARVGAALRRQPRSAVTTEGPLGGHGIEIHPGRHEVVVDGRAVSLTFTEFEILKFLASRPGWVFTRSQIVNAARGENYHVTERSADVHILSLRKKLGAAGKCIETVRGVGYRFKD